jgi:hypothetical protein
MVAAITLNQQCHALPVCFAHPRGPCGSCSGRAEQNNLHAARFAFGTDTTRAESAIGVPASAERPWPRSHSVAGRPALGWL